MPNFEEDFEKSKEGIISVLVIEPMNKPYTQEIGSGLVSLQKAVGGDIEAVYPYEDQVALVCNEEGKLNGLQLNRALRDEDGDVYDIIAGTFLVTGLTEDNFGSLSAELQRKYAEQFNQPEMFAQVNGKIVVIPVDAEQERSQKRTIDIYQLKDDEIGKKMSFMNFDYLKSFNMPVSAEKYNKIYTGDMKQGEDLEGVYIRFNLNHPADYRGHSLSISDVVVVHENGKDSAHFVDSYGFKDMLKDYPDVMNIEQMCEILGVSTKTGYRILRSGQISCLKVGRAYRIPKAHLFTFLSIGCFDVGEAMNI